eukprot:SAG25_NODE_5761_length_623_cov_1.250000_2_plen_52_part_01
MLWLASSSSRLIADRVSMHAARLRRFKSLKPSHKGGPPQTVVRGGTCVNRRG